MRHDLSTVFAALALSPDQMYSLSLRSDVCVSRDKKSLKAIKSLIDRNPAPEHPGATTILADNGHMYSGAYVLGLVSESLPEAVGIARQLLNLGDSTECTPKQICPDYADELGRLLQHHDLDPHDAVTGRDWKAFVGPSVALAITAFDRGWLPVLCDFGLRRNNAVLEPTAVPEPEIAEVVELPAEPGATHMHKKATRLAWLAVALVILIGFGLNLKKEIEIPKEETTLSESTFSSRAYKLPPVATP